MENGKEEQQPLYFDGENVGGEVGRAKEKGDRERERERDREREREREKREDRGNRENT